MDRYQAAVLRLECLKASLGVAMTRHEGFYSVVSDAEKYWLFVKGPDEVETPSIQNKIADGDDIPF